MATKLVVAMLMLVPVTGTGAFGTHWVLDVRDPPDDWAGEQLFRASSAKLGPNPFVLIVSHASQYWFKVYGLWAGDDVMDISDIYVRSVRSSRNLTFIGWMSYLFLMSLLLPAITGHGITLPWHEVVIQSNDYPGEDGCRITIRNHAQPRVWWQMRTACTSIPRGSMMLKYFKTLALPRFLVADVYNFAAWKPYWQVSGPLFFFYMPHKSLVTMDVLEQMREEERYMAKAEPIHDVSKAWKIIRKAYAMPYEEGAWLNKKDWKNVKAMRKSIL
jgi:hypothetical protein